MYMRMCISIDLSIEVHNFLYWYDYVTFGATFSNGCQTFTQQYSFGATLEQSFSMYNVYPNPSTSYVTTTIDVSQLPKNNYLLRVYNGKNWHTQKLIITK